MAVMGIITYFFKGIHWRERIANIAAIAGLDCADQQLSDLLLSCSKQEPFSRVFSEQKLLRRLQNG
jgi:hypothetical protein